MKPWLALLCLAPASLALLAISAVALYRRIRFGSWYR